MIRKIKPITLLNGVLAVCLVSALLFTSGTITGSGDEEKQYDPWVDYNDDGVIDIQDIVKTISLYDSHGTPLNKTDLLLELVDRVNSIEKLQNQSRTLRFLDPVEHVVKTAMVRLVRVFWKGIGTLLPVTGRRLRTLQVRQPFSLHAV